MMRFCLHFYTRCIISRKTLEQKTILTLLFHIITQYYTLLHESKMRNNADLIRNDT